LRRGAPGGATRRAACARLAQRPHASDCAARGADQILVPIRSAAALAAALTAAVRVCPPSALLRRGLSGGPKQPPPPDCRLIHTARRPYTEVCAARPGQPTARRSPAVKAPPGSAHGAVHKFPPPPPARVPAPRYVLEAEAMKVSAHDPRARRRGHAGERGVAIGDERGEGGANWGGRQDV
jgi:hypothetical protein